MRIGARHQVRSSRIRSMPSLSGRPRSISRSSGLRVVACTTASFAFAASVTSKPCAARLELRKRRIASSSSTTRIRSFGSTIAASLPRRIRGALLRPAPFVRTAREDRGQRDHELGAAPLAISGADRPAVRLDDALADREPEPGAAPLAVPRAAYELLEDALELVGREAG